MTRLVPRQGKLIVDLLPIIAFGLLIAASMLQLIWMRRVVRRAQRWIVNLSDRKAMITTASYCRIATGVWLVAATLGAILCNVLPFRSSFSWEVIAEIQAMMFAGAIWSPLMALVSHLCVKACNAIEQSPARPPINDTTQSTGSPSPQLAGLFLDAETAGAIWRRWSTVGTVTWLSLSFVTTLVGFVVLSALLSLLESNQAGVFSLMILCFLILIPGVVALVISRWAVSVKARRAQFLWFLALTAEKHRPFARELQQWALNHPGAFGVRVMEAVRDLANGELLAVAFSGRRLVDPSDLISIRVAEQTGRLPETLRETAMRHTNALHNDVLESASSGPFVYLGALILVAFNVVGFVMYFIIPKFKQIFLGFGEELPRVTILFINFSGFLVQYFYLIFGLAPLLVIWLIATCGDAYFRGWSETRLAWMIGVGRQAEVPRILRRLRQAVVANVPWQAALYPMVRDHHRPIIRISLERVLDRVLIGLNLWTELSAAGLLSAQDVNLLVTAERANNLPWALNALADAKEQSLTHRWRIITSFVAPIGTIVCGACIGVICWAFFMPLVKLLYDLN